jgi:hypothetical protein
MHPRNNSLNRFVIGFGARNKGNFYLESRGEHEDQGVLGGGLGRWRSHRQYSFCLHEDREADAASICGKQWDLE